MFNREFLTDALERAIKTGLQALGAMFVGGVTVASVDWQLALTTAGTAMLLSIITSIGSRGIGDHGSAAALGSKGRHAA